MTKGEHALADTVVLVRATNFGVNPETLASNAFQLTTDEQGVSEKAVREQASLANALARAGVNVILFDPPANSRSPDGVFPNNWFSTHDDGRLVLYPMEAPSRRGERLPGLAKLLREYGFHVDVILDMTSQAKDGKFLEGTGSLVLDRANHVAYACASSRTHPDLAQEWARTMGFQLCWFTAQDPSGRPIYHTNVVMSLGAGLAIVCFEAIPEPGDRGRLRRSLLDSGQTILEINWKQVKAFAGNQLFLRGSTGPVAVLSDTANRALDAGQKDLLDKHATRCVADIATIERHGGGSVRCMLAEVFLPRAGS